VSEPAVLEGVVAPGDDPYRLLPFEVPDGCGRVTVRYRFDTGSILDLGLFDPRATGFPSLMGFRGWSGSARQEVFVARASATPGYLPGPLPAGRWHVILGAAKVAYAGCRYRVEVEVDAAGAARAEVPADDGDRQAQAGAPPAAPFSAGDHGPGWYPGDLQSHTHHSDARGSVPELLTAARARGLRYLAVTDHNTVSHWGPLRALSDGGLLGVPGMEVTTYRGHANVWGASDWVDFRVTEERDVETMVRRAHELGGLVSINHPKSQPGCIGCDWEYGVPAEVDAVEAWQGPWPLRNWESLERLDRLLSGGRRLTLVGGSDRHQPAGPELDPPWLRVGSPTTWLWLERFEVSAVLEAIASGRAFVSEGPAGPHLEIDGDGLPMGSRLRPGRGAVSLRASVAGAAGDRLRWLGAGGVLREVPIEGERFEDGWMYPCDSPFVRAEIVADASLPARRQAVEELADANRRAGKPALPYGITLPEVLSRPFVRALSNPLFVSAANAGARGWRSS
jgi:hypothetical protein